MQNDDPSALEMRDFQAWLQSTQIGRVLPIISHSSLSLCDSVQVFTDIRGKASGGKCDVDEVEGELIKGLGAGILSRMEMVSKGAK